MERQRWLDGTLYSPDFEQDSCGFGLIAQIDNQPSHTLVQNAIGSLACMTHRGAIAADVVTGSEIICNSFTNVDSSNNTISPTAATWLGAGATLHINSAPKGRRMVVDDPLTDARTV